MKALFKALGSILLALFLALSWIWAIVLKDLNLIDDSQRVWVVIALTVVLLFHQVYLVLPEPAGRGTIEARKPVIESYLQGFLDKYYECLESLESSGDGRPQVRANIMLPTKYLKGLLGTYLKIYYVACPPGIAYNDQELAIRWKKGAGTCGWCWKSGDSCLYDSQDRHLSLPGGRLDNRRHGAVLVLNSTFSIPIWDNARVVGVLNLDSNQDNSKTHFTDPAVYTLAIGCAQTLAAHCFTDGVAA